MLSPLSWRSYLRSDWACLLTGIISSERMAAILRDESPVDASVHIGDSQGAKEGHVARKAWLESLVSLQWIFLASALKTS